MTDKFGRCRTCGGSGIVRDPVLHVDSECPGCLGNGWSGDIRDWMEKDDKKWEKENEYWRASQ